MWELLLMMVAMFAILYLLMIRPQKKRFAEHQATIDALQPGVRVLLTSGIFGTLSHIGERHAIVELAPGTEVTLLKNNIARPVEADEEEFELTDEDLAQDDPFGTDDFATDGLTSDDIAADAGQQDLPTADSGYDEPFDPRGKNA